MDASITRIPAAAQPRVLVGGAAVLALMAVVKVALHLVPTALLDYGYFVDELYYLACSEHLARGFVDMPPLFPAITALIRATLGDSLLALRLLPALAGAALVAMTGLLARDLGGRRFAQGISALAVLTAPIWLALHSIHTMNALDQLFWTGGAWIVVRIVRDGWDKGWLAFGALAGFGLLDKHSMAFFGAAVGRGSPAHAGAPGVPLALALAGRRHRPGPLPAQPDLGGRNGFPHFEMLANIKAGGRDVQLNPLAFMAQQVLFMNPLSLPLWLGGLAWFLFDREGRRYRVLGLAWLAVMAEMLLLDGRPYYPAPAYPMLLAGGGVALERWLAARSWGRIARPAYASLLAVSGAALAPLFTPLLPPETLIRYSEATGMSQPRIENHRLGPLPQLMADRYGWQEMAAEVARVYHALPPEDRARAAIFGQNYGQAGAIDRFGPAMGLPKAVSGHVSYYLWGPRDYTGEVMIVLDDDRETLEGIFESVELAGHVSHPYSMPYQHFDVWVCRGLRMPMTELWPRVKSYD